MKNITKLILCSAFFTLVFTQVAISSRAIQYLSQFGAEYLAPVEIR